MEFCCTCPGVELLSPLWSQAHCAPWWKIYSLRSQMMMTAPLGKRQQSKQTQSAGIPGGNKSGRKMFVVFLPSMFGIFVPSVWREESKWWGYVWEESVREGEKGQMCEVLSTEQGYRVNDNSRLGTELDEERSPELKERKPLRSGTCWALQVLVTEPLKIVT